MDMQDIDQTKLEDMIDEMGISVEGDYKLSVLVAGAVGDALGDVLKMMDAAMVVAMMAVESEKHDELEPFINVLDMFRRQVIKKREGANNSVKNHIHEMEPSLKGHDFAVAVSMTAEEPNEVVVQVIRACDARAASEEESDVQH